MKTIILEQPGHFITKQTTLNDELLADEALLKVHRVGVCGTDLHAYRGKQPFFSYPRILGHEVGVEVVNIGSAVDQVRIGDRCSIEPYFNAANDQAVRRGLTNCGENLSVLGVHEDGAMREFIKVKARYLHASDSLTYEQLALIEPLSIGCHAVNRAQLTKDDLVLVIGAGPIGLGAVQFAKLAGSQVVAMDLNNQRLEFASQQLNVDGTINPKTVDPKSGLQEIFGGDLPTVIFDATGNKQSMKNTLDYAGPGAKIVFIGLFIGDFSFYDPLFHKKEITLMASRNSLSSDFKQIIQQMEAGLINTDSWITHRVSIDDLADEFESFLDPANQVIKAMIHF